MEENSKDKEKREPNTVLFIYFAKKLHQKEEEKEEEEEEEEGLLS